nr:hypothetical protein HmN_000245200 [Hymenolepis microstoma]
MQIHFRLPGLTSRVSLCSWLSGANSAFYRCVIEIDDIYCIHTTTCSTLSDPNKNANDERIHADRDLSIPQCHGGTDHRGPYPFGCLTNTLLRNNFSFTHIELRQMKSSRHACNALEEMLLA